MAPNCQARRVLILIVLSRWTQVKGKIKYISRKTRRSILGSVYLMKYELEKEMIDRLERELRVIWERAKWEMRESWERVKRELRDSWERAGRELRELWELLELLEYLICMASCFISVLEAKASKARGHSGHEATPNTPFLILTPPLYIHYATGAFTKTGLSLCREKFVSSTQCLQSC